MSTGIGLKGDWVKPFKIGPYIVMFSKAPFYFSGWLPTTRWGSLAWRRYEFKVFRERLVNPRTHITRGQAG